MPGSEVEGEEGGGRKEGDGESPARPANRLAGDACKQEEKRRGERQPPEAGGDRTRIGHAHQPGPERQSDIAKQQRRIGKGA